MTKRLAEDWLRSVMDEARRGTLPGMVKTGATCADAAAEWLRYIEVDRAGEPSDRGGLPGDRPLAAAARVRSHAA